MAAVFISVQQKLTFRILNNRDDTTIRIFDINMNFASKPLYKDISQSQISADAMTIFR